MFLRYFKIIFCGALLTTSVCAQNYAIRFRGNGTGDIDRIKIPIDNPHVLCDVGLDFTIEFKIKCLLTDNPLGSSATEGANDDWTMGHIIIDRDIFGNGDYGDYGISLANGRIAFGVNNGTNSYTIISNNSVADNMWHTIAVTRDATSSTLQIFIDGVLDKSVNSNVTDDISYRDNRTTSWANDPYIVLGAEKHDYDNTLYPSYNGLLDELRISNIVRYSSNYIVSNAELTDDSNTVALYHVNEGSGNIITNSAAISLNSCDGILSIGGNPQGPEWVLINDTSNNLYNNNFHHISHPFVYPTITSNSLSILNLNHTAFEKIEVLNMQLQKVFETTKIIHTFDLSYFKNGVYFLKIYQNNHIYCQRIVKT